jgi:enterobactin synthetase component D
VTTTTGPVAVGQAGDGRDPRPAHRTMGAVTPADAAAVMRAVQAGRPGVPGLGFSVASRWDRAAAQPYPTESRLASRLPAQRRAEFLAGRRAMRGALAGIGVAAGEIPYDGRRPRLPAGSVGSISHSRGIAVALAGPGRLFAAVGADLELSSLPLAAAHLVLCGPELAWLERAAGNPGEAQRRLLAAFSAKESAFKVIDALSDRSPRLREIRLCPAVDGFAAQLQGARGPLLRVRVRHVPSGVLTWTVLPGGDDVAGAVTTDGDSDPASGPDGEVTGVGGRA